ncbi:unnamed protein product [Paramecium octaurelia]|uniref:Uncharacterized protein n=1 Tax=Paramecium octaurelia TaxID=43137 RepID=A0A8S1VY31_PAROT|nr:unnamed protein product [Paramecium octaurelia]
MNPLAVIKVKIIRILYLIEKESKAFETQLEKSQNNQIEIGNRIEKRLKSKLQGYLIGKLSDKFQQFRLDYQIQINKEDFQISSERSTKLYDIVKQRYKTEKIVTIEPLKEQGMKYLVLLKDCQIKKIEVYLDCRTLFEKNQQPSALECSRISRVKSKEKFREEAQASQFRFTKRFKNKKYIAAKA